MVKKFYTLTCTEELTSLIKNMEYYHKQINDMVRKEIDLNINKFDMDAATESNIDIQLACLNACLATNDWITDCISNYRVLIQKANMGLKPTTDEERKNATESKSTTTETTKQVSTETERSTPTSADDIPF